MKLAVVKREYHTLENTRTDRGILVDREDVTFADGSVMKKYIPKEEQMADNGLQPGYREQQLERRVVLLELEIQQLKGKIARLEAKHDD